eukprot:SAG31_NODE_11106_length_1066_cov_0.871768_1_plen_254_part_01
MDGEVHRVSGYAAKGSEQVLLHNETAVAVHPGAQSLRILRGDGRTIDVPVEHEDFANQVNLNASLQYCVDIVCDGPSEPSKLKGATVQTVVDKGKGVVAEKNLKKGHVVLVERPRLQGLKYRNRDALVALVLMYPEQYGELCATEMWVPLSNDLKTVAGNGLLKVNGRCVTAVEWSRAQQQVASNMFVGDIYAFQSAASLEPDQPIFLHQRQASAFNHDSNPNLAFPTRSSTGAIAFRTTRPVAAGEELCFKYS